MGIINEKSCGIVLFHEGKTERRYLVLHYPDGHWDLPKGHVEGEETEHETALRELEEETGITDIEFIENYREEISYTFKNKHNGGQHTAKTVIYFLARSNEKEVKISHEHQDYKWLPYDAAFNKVSFDNAKNLLRKAEKF